VNSLAAAAWRDARQAMTDGEPVGEILAILSDVTVLDPEWTDRVRRGGGSYAEYVRRRDAYYQGLAGDPERAL